MITFRCRECAKRIFVKDELAGKRAQCPRCYKYLAVPEQKERNWHLQEISLALLTVIIIGAVSWIVYFYSNGGGQS